MDFYFDSTINFLSLILGIIAVMIACITLIIAIEIRTSEKETRREVIQNKRDKFEFILRAFYSYIFRLNMMRIPKSGISNDFIINSVELSLILLKDLRIALIDYKPTDHSSLTELQSIEHVIFLLQQVNSIKNDPNSFIMWKSPIRAIERIAKQYKFDL